MKKFALTIKQVPKTQHNKSSFNYLNYKRIRFEFNDEAKQLFLFMKSKFDKNYPVELTFEAYGGSLRKDQLCKKMQITTLHVNNFDAYIQHRAILQKIHYQMFIYIIFKD